MEILLTELITASWLLGFEFVDVGFGCRFTANLAFFGEKDRKTVANFHSIQTQFLKI